MSGQPTMGGFVFRRVQEGYHGEPAITRERKHFSKIHPSDCKPSTRLACSYLNWSEEVSAALCSAVDRTKERTNDKTTTVTLQPRLNNSSISTTGQLVTQPRTRLFLNLCVGGKKSLVHTDCACAKFKFHKLERM